MSTVWLKMTFLVVCGLFLSTVWLKLPFLRKIVNSLTENDVFDRRVVLRACVFVVLHHVLAFLV